MQTNLYIKKREKEKASTLDCMPHVRGEQVTTTKQLVHYSRPCCDLIVSCQPTVTGCMIHIDLIMYIFFYCAFNNLKI